MKFLANTHPISEGLDLCIIQSNITKFYQKSCIVELTIENNALRINTEASAIKSELVIKGQASGDGSNHLFVDSLLFKNLLKTIDSDTVEFEFRDDGLVVHSGKSKFNLPQVISGDDLELARPEVVYDSSNLTEVNKSGWEFIKDNQMYAVAMSFIHPVYTNAWMSESGDVIVGDFDNSIFTHSSKAQLSSTCLLTDTVINLLTTVPDNSRIIPNGKNYMIKVDTDPYTYVCEFEPKYESDEGVGDYSADIILGLFQKPESSISLDISKISKYISQAELFTATNDDTIDLAVIDNVFTLSNQNVDCKIPVSNPFSDFSITFKISLLKDLISHMDNNDVNLCPLIQSGEAAGIIVWTDNMEAMLAGIESGE